MSNIPDFASASYPEIKAGAPSPASETETWMTNEQIPVPPTYSESVYDDCLHLDFTAGVAAQPPRTVCHHVCGAPLDGAPVRRLSTAEESNAFYRRNLAAGQKGLSLPLTWRRTAAMTPTTPAWWVTWARPAWPWTPSWTGNLLQGIPWTKCPSPEP